MRRFVGCLVVLTLALLWVTGLPLQSQPPSERVYEPFVPTPEYEMAERLLLQNRIEAAREIWARIAAQNPGTTLGAVSLFDQAKWSDTRQEAMAINQAIVTGYPRSQFEVNARLNLLNLQYGYTNMEGWIAAADQLAQSYGGPALEDILRGRDLDRLTARVHS
ncbi:MAG: hypothetical protein AB1758_37015, partial [Candidatus Eremiobacterota bacterium]